MSNVYAPSGRFGGGNNAVDMTKCRASVWHASGNWGNSTQCTRKVAVEEDGYGWCRQHAPSTEENRWEEKRQRWDRESKARDWVAKQTLLERGVVTAAMAWHMGNTAELLAALTAACEALRLHRYPPKVES